MPDANDVANSIAEFKRHAARYNKRIQRGEDLGRVFSAALETLKTMDDRKREKQEQERLKKEQLEKEQRELEQTKDITKFRSGLETQEYERRRLVEMGDETSERERQGREAGELVEFHKADLEAIDADIAEAVATQDWTKLISARSKITRLPPALQAMHKEAIDDAKDIIKGMREETKAKTGGKALGPARQALIQEYDQLILNEQDPETRRGYMLIRAAIEEGEGYSEILKQAKEGLGGEGKDATESLHPEQQRASAQELLGPMGQQAEKFVPETGIPKSAYGRGPVNVGIRQEDLGPLGSGQPSVLIPGNAGVEKWATDFAQTYANRIKAEAELWKLDKFRENSPHNITDMRVKADIAREIDEEMGGSEKGSTSAQIMGLTPEPTGGLDKAILIDRAISDAETAFIKKGITDRQEMIKQVQANPDRWAVALASHGLTIEEFLEAFETVMTSAP